MSVRRILALLVMFAMPIGIGSVSAQIPDKFTNLKVLPKDISKRELIDIMRAFSDALGERCTYCHPGKNPDTLEGIDFASDELKHKQISRDMMRMVGEINDRLIPAAGMKSPAQVRCVTCHRGVTEPESLDRVILSVAKEKGVDAAIGRYRELRGQYYGTGSYSFSPGTLNTVAEKLAQEQDNLAGAISVMKLNVEENPDAAYSHLLLGRFLAENGDREAAIASMERSLELEPDNEWAKKLLEQTRGGE
ncbi:MAG TPA: c-type cytochrome [Candidatus Polarisedimenticolia bacterium]|nr:c-type cytochrome [Candidatus Polarisedimenticolia bacterium]